MKKTCVADIKDRDLVQGVFLVKEKILAMAKNGKPYLTLKLMDKTGELDAKVWDNADEVGCLFDRNDFLSICGKASVYLGKMQLIVSELQKVPEEQVQLSEFLPETERDIDIMVQELHALVASIKDPHLQLLLRRFFEDPELLACYRVAPAAKGMHHVYLGGLLEHSLAVARLVEVMVPLYSGLNRDLLVAGALLHDVGKVREMTYLRSFDYSDEGKLIGHITIGVEMLQEKICGIPGFPLELGMLLKHMILSHHGQYEYGSPKRPKTIEATVLNYLDDLDSKINGIRTHIRKEPENPARWTSYHRLYDRYFFKENGLVEEELVQEYRQEPVVEAPRHERPHERAQERPAERAQERPAERAHDRGQDRGQEKAAKERERKAFTNNPFAALKDENLDLF